MKVTLFLPKANTNHFQSKAKSKNHSNIIPTLDISVQITYKLNSNRPSSLYITQACGPVYILRPA